MNYFELHLGDYAEATAHLTFVEDAAYIRMLRKYYSTEKPLPADIKAVQRLVAARTKEEREAVETILGEFFVLQDDGWHNARCDAELARFKDGEPEREVKKANEENRLKRHREERARLFKQLTDAGQHAPWNISMGELRELVKQLPATEPETELQPLPETPPATAPATPATATQTPLPNTQTPVLKPEDHRHHASSIGDPVAGDPADFEPPLFGAPLPPREEPPAPEGDNQPAIALTVDLRKWGVNATFTHPAVQDWANRNVSRDILAAAVAEAREVKGSEKIAPNYLVPIVERLLNPPAKTEPAPSKPKSDDWAWKRSNASIDAKGRELGMFARGGESYPDFAARIQAALDKRKGQQR